MPSDRKARKLYTDAPDLHPSLILGSMQLLAWLMFHPAAWASYVAQIDQDLDSDFCLLGLTLAQWRDPLVRRLLLRLLLICPLIAGTLLAALLLILARAEENVSTALAHLFGLPLQHVAITGEEILIVTLASLVGGIAVNLALSLAVGAGTGAATGFVSNILGGLASMVTVSLAGMEGISKMEAGATLNTLGEIGNYEAYTLWTSLSQILVVCLAAGIGNGVGGHIVPRKVVQYHSPARRIGGVFIGLIFSGIVLYGASTAAGSIGQTGLQAALGDVRQKAAYGLLIGLVLGMAFGGAAGWHTRHWRRSFLVGIAISVTCIGLWQTMAGLSDALTHSTMGRVVFSISVSVGNGTLLSILFTLPYLPAKRMGGSWAGAVASCIGSGGIYAIFMASTSSETLWPIIPTGFGCLLLGLTMYLWLPALAYPLETLWSLSLLRLDDRRGGSGGCLLALNSAFFHEHQRFPLPGLEEHLVLVAERNPLEGQAALDYLSTSHQRWAAQTAQIELDARRLERCRTVEGIGQLHYGLAVGELSGPASAVLRSFSNLSRDTEAAMQQSSRYNQRLALMAVADRIRHFSQELIRSNERYMTRFKPIAESWAREIESYIAELTTEVEQRQEIPSPYVIGVPLSEHQEVFVGRTDVGARIEALLLDASYPPLFLYGQRRMGKTSLLNNLSRLLPHSIIPCFIDLQGPVASAMDYAGFLYNVARSMIKSAEHKRQLHFPALPRERLAIDPFTVFDEWLDEVEQAANMPEQHTILLAFDEFEILNRAILEGRFDEGDMLGMLRHLIQHRTNFKVLLSGSHTLEELGRWASFLINVQTVHISYLHEDDARQLIEKPVRSFPLTYRADASQRIIEVTRCHPFLLQLLCSEIIALKNRQPAHDRRMASVDDVEAAVPGALESGTLFFADIEHNQVDADELAVLRCLASHGESTAVPDTSIIVELQSAKDLNQSLGLLMRRELIEKTQEGYRVQVELVRRWFA